MTNEKCETCPNRMFCMPVFESFDRFQMSRPELIELVKSNRFPCAEKDRSQDGPLFWIAAEIQKWWDDNA